MPNPCPIAPCLGRLHKRGKGRSPVCSVCGYRKILQRGRPRKDPGRLVSDRDVYLAKKTAADRQVKYALFDPSLVPEGSIGFIHKAALVGVVVGCSRVSVELDRLGLKAIPIGSLRAREKRWVKEFEERKTKEN